MGKRGKLLIALIAAVGTLIFVPLLFSLFFRGSGSSSFLGYPTQISVENWFSFWITFLAGISSVAVAVIALSISLKTEKARIENRRNSERLLFVPLRIGIKPNWNALTFIAYMPRELTLLKGVDIVGADCSFEGASLDVEAKLSLDMFEPYFTLAVSDTVNSESQASMIIKQWEQDSASAGGKACKKHVS